MNEDQEQPQADGFLPPNQEPTADVAAQHAAEAAARGESAPTNEPYPADPIERQERTNSEMADLSGGAVAPAPVEEQPGGTAPAEGASPSD